MTLGNEQRRIVAYLDGLPPIGDLRQAKVNAFPLTLFGDDVREPRKGVILQSQSQEELRPLFGRTLLPLPTGMISVLDRAFKGEL